MSIVNTLREQFQCEPLNSATQIVVAYSGGVDSHVLLHALHEFRQLHNFSFSLSAIHIHHGLSQHADLWQAHCQQVCKALDIDFSTTNVAVSVGARTSLEAKARAARYNALVELAPSGSQVLLGQHQDDQLETFLLQLKRGAGPKGLSAMNRSWSRDKITEVDKKVGFYRPLLGIPQPLILAYAQQYNLQWCEDDSNQNTAFERNFLRHQVLPIIQKRWAEFPQAVARSAALCAEQQSLLDEISDDKLEQLKASDNSLHLPALRRLTQPWLHQLVRYWLSKLGIPSPPLAVLSQLEPQVLNATQDAKPILQWQDWQFRRFDQQLFVISIPATFTVFEKVWEGSELMHLPNNLGDLLFSTTQTNSVSGNTQIRVDPSLGPLIIRLGGYSTKFKPAGGNHTKPVKQWFKQWKIAPWIRQSVIFIVQEEEVLALLIEGRWYPSQKCHELRNTQLTVTLKLKADV